MFSVDCLKRSFDVGLALAALVVLAMPMMLIAALVKLTSRGPVLYWSNRVGAEGRIYSMPKFRSMRTDAPVIATHLLMDANQWITPIGSFLRKSSLDELPQLWSILIGDMSFVGPRPALFNQQDLIQLRIESNVGKLVPGLTGWAQIHGRDELSISDKVAQDRYYLEHRSLLLDVQIILATFVKVLRSDGIKQADDRVRAPKRKSYVAATLPSSFQMP